MGCPFLLAIVKLPLGAANNKIVNISNMSDIYDSGLDRLILDRAVKSLYGHYSTRTVVCY